MERGKHVHSGLWHVLKKPKNPFYVHADLLMCVKHSHVAYFYLDFCLLKKIPKYSSQLSVSMKVAAGV